MVGRENTKRQSEIWQEKAPAQTTPTWKLLNSTETAALLGVSTRTLGRLRAQGVIPFIRIGRLLRYHRVKVCLLYTSPSPRDGLLSRMPSSA